MTDFGDVSIDQLFAETQAELGGEPEDEAAPATEPDESEGQDEDAEDADTPSADSDEEEGVAEDDSDDYHTEDESLDEVEDSGPDDESGELEDEQPSAGQAEARELELLKQQLAQTQQQLAALVRERETVSQQQQAQPDPHFREAVKILLNGGDDKALQDAGIPPATRTAAARFAVDYSERFVDEALNPEIAFQRFAPLVQRMVQEVVAPVHAQTVQQKADELLARHADVLKTDADKARVGEILRTIPGANEGWDVQLRRLDLAVGELVRERAGERSAKEAQRLRDSRRQQKANRKARRGAGKQRSRKGAPPPPPDMEPNEDMEHYHARLLEHERKYGG